MHGNVVAAMGPINATAPGFHGHGVHCNKAAIKKSNGSHINHGSRLPGEGVHVGKAQRHHDPEAPRTGS